MSYSHSLSFSCSNCRARPFLGRIIHGCPSSATPRPLNVYMPERKTFHNLAEQPLSKIANAEEQKVVFDPANLEDARRLGHKAYPMWLCKIGVCTSITTSRAWYTKRGSIWLAFLGTLPRTRVRMRGIAGEHAPAGMICLIAASCWRFPLAFRARTNPISFAPLRVLSPLPE
jgi:hypothetical protein